MDESIENIKEFASLTLEEANDLVLEHRGWAESIARSVARSWNLDWQMDGLDGAAMEAIIFCARRFQPERGVPFRGYARRRIHESATEAARKCRGWRKSTDTGSSTEERAREISSDLLQVFPELRSGELPSSGDEGGGGHDGDPRASIRQLIMGANLLAFRDGEEGLDADEALDFKKVVKIAANLEPVHQMLLWKVYWEGLSLRTVASEWETDGLNVIREHKALLQHLSKALSVGKQTLTRPKIRPGLRPIALQMKKNGDAPPFTTVFERSGSATREKQGARHDR